MDSAPPNTGISQVALVPARPEHAELCWKWRHDAVAKQFNPYDDLTLDELTMRFGAVGGDLRNRAFKAYRWMVHAPGAGLVGTVSLRVNWRMLHGELGYQIDRAWQGRGLGLAAVNALIELAFTTSDLVRLFATISVGNEASRRLIERLGFVHEGTLRGHHLIGGRFVDQWVYGLLRQEWRGGAAR